MDVRAVLDNSLIMVKEKAIKHGIQIQFSTNFDSTSKAIWADERKLKKILYNLLSNAIKFTPDGGKIRLAADLAESSELKTQGKSGSFQLSASDSELHRDWVQLSVKDTGIGLGKEDLVRIFNPFEQVDGSVNRRYQGAGLGLSLTKRLVELHGGKIWVESEGEGKGSIFYFIIPVEV